MSRGIINLITNRDIVEKQNDIIKKYRESVEEKDEIIAIQSEAISEFGGSVKQLTTEIGKLKATLYPRRNTVGKKEDE